MVGEPRIVGIAEFGISSVSNSWYWMNAYGAARRELTRWLVGQASPPSG
ncbi:MAG: hypothetical protein Q8P18_29860 [Pseudomonadota bacterium]|nr:hypothetical protein [Pseudomonadota bacterium]